VRSRSRSAAALALLSLLFACTDTSDGSGALPTPDASEEPALVSPASSPSPERAPVTERPEWLGERVLPLRPDGFGQIRPTPKILRNRRLATIDLLPPPEDDGFISRARSVPDEVLSRSTWGPGCPVDVDELRYVRVSFWGFDRETLMGELLVHRSAARDLVSVFRHLYRERFPIEEMRVVRRAELDAPPTGDGNNTTAFVCRNKRGSQSFSEHAYGLAVDINPFHNPYVKDDVVLPELASAYKDRGWKRPGMILEGGPVVDAFDRIGWGWGGRWNSLVDYMHFSESGG
jgi:hypothetical protein